LLNGAEIPVTETFTIEQQVRGTSVTSARSAPGTELRVEARYSLEGGVECALEWTSELDGMAARVVASYSVAPDGSIAARWSTNDAAERTETIPVGSGPVPMFFPLMRVFSGRSLAKLVAVAPQPLPVLVPDIRDPKNVDAFLTPLLGDRFAASVAAGSCLVDDAAHPCDVVDYRGGSYDSDATVYLDNGGLLLRYTWPQEGAGEWDVQLCEIEGPWPTPSQW